MQVHMDWEDLAQWNGKYSNKWLPQKGFLPVPFGPRGTLRKTPLLAALIVRMGLSLTHRSKITFSIMCDCALPSPCVFLYCCNVRRPQFSTISVFLINVLIFRDSSCLSRFFSRVHICISSSLSILLPLPSSVSPFGFSYHHWLVNCPLCPYCYTQQHLSALPCLSSPIPPGLADT